MKRRLVGEFQKSEAGEGRLNRLLLMLLDMIEHCVYYRLGLRSPRLANGRVIKYLEMLEDVSAVVIRDERSHVSLAWSSRWRR